MCGAVAAFFLSGCFDQTVNGNSPEPILGDYTLDMGSDNLSVGGKVTFGLDKEPRNDYDGTEVVVLKNFVWRVPGCAIVDYSTLPKTLTFAANTNQVAVPDIKLEQECNATHAVLSMRAIAQINDGYETRTEYEKDYDYNLSIRNRADEVAGNNPNAVIRSSAVFYAADYKNIDGQIVIGLDREPKNSGGVTESVTLDNFVLDIPNCAGTYAVLPGSLYFTDAQNQQIAPSYIMPAACFEATAKMQYREVHQLDTPYGKGERKSFDRTVELVLHSPTGGVPSDPTAGLTPSYPDVGVSGTMTYAADYTSASGQVAFSLSKAPSSNDEANETASVSNIVAVYSSCPTMGATVTPSSFVLGAGKTSESVTIEALASERCSDDKVVLQYDVQREIVAASGSKSIGNGAQESAVSLLAPDGSPVGGKLANENYAVAIAPVSSSLSSGGKQSIHYSVSGADSGIAPGEVYYVRAVSSDGNVSVINLKVPNSGFDYTGPKVGWYHAPADSSAFTLVGVAAGSCDVSMEFTIEKRNGQKQYVTKHIAVTVN